LFGDDLGKKGRRGLDSFLESPPFPFGTHVTTETRRGLAADGEGAGPRRLEALAAHRDGLRRGIRTRWCLLLSGGRGRIGLSAGGRGGHPGARGSGPSHGGWGDGHRRPCGGGGGMGAFLGGAGGAGGSKVRKHGDPLLRPREVVPCQLRWGKIKTVKYPTTPPPTNVPKGQGRGQLRPATDPLRTSHIER